MNITEELIDDHIVKINLSGRMDIEGVGQIETKFAGMAASARPGVIVDMSDVPYMSSIGIRALLVTASLAQRSNLKTISSDMSIPRMIASNQSLIFRTAESSLGITSW